MNSARRSACAPVASVGRLLSTDPSRPIDIREIHVVQNLHVFRAFQLRAVIEQVQRHSSSVIAKAVLNRLTFIQELFKHDDDDKKKTDSLTERVIRKQTRNVNEVLGYLNYYLDHTSGQTSITTFAIDVFHAGLETLVTMLESSENVRHAVTRHGWDLLVELLRRHHVRLRALVCEVMSLCFVRQPPPFTDPIQYPLSAADQQWNMGIAARVTENAACYSALFEQPHSDWGMQATHAMQLVVLLTCRAFLSTVSGTPQIIQNLETLLGQYDAHVEVILERRQALHLRFEKIMEDREAVLAERQKLGRHIDALIASSCRDSARTKQVKQTHKKLNQRQHEINTRSKTYEMELAATR